MDASSPAPFARVVRVERTGSTSTELRAAATADPAAWPHLSVLVAREQDAGRGRAGRSWVTAPGTALTASILLRPRVPAERLAWVTLLAGLAVQRATAELAGLPTAIKWPNDVLVVGAGEEIPGWGRDRKVAGILAEVLPPAPGSAAGPGSGPASRTGGQAPAVVLGIGVNVRQSPDQLPVEWATSLAVAGAAAPMGGAPTVDEVLQGVGVRLADLLARWERAGGDAESAGLADEVRGACVTLGRPVRAELPGGAVVTGTATGIDGEGRLLVRDESGETTSVQAGDVLHVRVAQEGVERGAQDGAQG